MRIHTYIIWMEVITNREKGCGNNRKGKEDCMIKRLVSRNG